MRTSGQVTSVVTGKEVACDRAPITVHTNELSPCSSSHGWKWSEIHRASNPAVLCEPSLADQLSGRMLFARQKVAKRSHASLPVSVGDGLHTRRQSGRHDLGVGADPRAP